MVVFFVAGVAHPEQVRAQGHHAALVGLFQQLGRVPVKANIREQLSAGMTASEEEVACVGVLTLAKKGVTGK